MADRNHSCPGCGGVSRGDALRGYTARGPGSAWYTETPWGQRHYANIRRAVDWFGAHLICPLRACRRGGRCSDDDARHLPFCFEHYRGQIRFALTLVQARLQASPPAGAEETEEVGPLRGPSFLEAMIDRGLPIEHMRRPVEAGPDQWSWEQCPDALALLAEFKADGEARRRR